MSLEKEQIVLLQNFLHSPGSFFEHKIFATLSLFMRNLTEQWQDYRGYYYSLPDHLFFTGLNTSSLSFDDEVVELGDGGTGVETELPVIIESSAYTIGLQVLRILVTILCVLTATWVINKGILRNRLIQYLVELLLCHLIILPMLPFMAIFFGTIAICRNLIWVHIQIFHRGKRYLVSPEDGFWAYEQHASSSSMIGLYMIEGECNVKKIREKVRQVVLSPVVKGKMTRRLRDFCGFAIWEEVDMKTWSVDQHIKIAKWPKSDKRSKDKSAPWSDKDVLDYLTTFQDRPAPRSKASWEVIIIPNMRMGGCGDTPHYACIFHVHHALMDGISSANILHQILADKPFKFTMDPVEMNASKKPGYFTRMLLYLAAFVLLPRTGLVNGLLQLDNQYNRFYSPGKTLKGPKHFAWSRPVKMEAIKKIKDTTKSSVMTVLLSSLGGSYRKMEQKRGGKGKKQPYIPEYYHALSPVAMLPYPDRHPRNGFSGVTLPVAVGKYASAYDRLQANHKTFKDLNIGMMDVMGNFILISMVGLMPTVLQRIFGGGVHFKLSLSNIPGSEEEIRIFDGDKIVDMGAWLPCKFTLGMAMGLFSYGGRCRATMVGDQTYLSKSDVELLTKNFETEICDLGRSLGMVESDIFY